MILQFQSQDDDDDDVLGVVGSVVDICWCVFFGYNIINRMILCGFGET